MTNAVGEPAGFRSVTTPAFALKGGYLVFASAPELIGRFAGSSAEKTASAGGGFPLVRLSLRELSRYLTERRATFVALTAKQHHVSEEEAGRQLDGLLTVLQFLDRIEVTQRSEPGRMMLTLHVCTSKPLK